MTIIDTHAHLNFNAYREDSLKVLQRSLDNGVWMINVGSQYSTSARAVKMAQNYPQGVYAAVGLHPMHLETGLVKIKGDPDEALFETTEENFDYAQYKDLAQNNKVVAIGEVGFDYYWRPKTKARQELFREKQKVVLKKQIDLAVELNLPVIFHCRMAHDELIELLGALGESRPRGVIHCFTGTWDQAQKYLEMGFYLGLNGIIFKMDIDNIIKKSPLDKILVETDCPYLTPIPMQGRNEPSYIKYVVEKIAKIKELSYNEISRATTENAKELFKI